MLRHAPQAYGLELDDEGWVDISAVLDALRRERGYATLTDADIRTVVAQATKQRHEISESRIRALYGHSQPVTKVPVAEPPDPLFHGTSPDFLSTILRDGLLPMRRQFVHLSADRETAHQAGVRKSRTPVILTIDTSGAAAAGIRFYHGNQNIWMSEPIPPGFISH